MHSAGEGVSRWACHSGGVDLEEFDALVTSLDGVRRRDTGGLAQWRWHGRLIARQLGGTEVVIRADFGTRDALLEEHPDDFWVPARFRRHMMVVTDCATADADAVEGAVVAAWHLQSGGR